jgi:hypothetical protein
MAIFTLLLCASETKIKKALLQKCLLKKAFSAVRLSLSTSVFLKDPLLCAPRLLEVCLYRNIFFLTVHLAFARDKWPYLPFSSTHPKTKTKKPYYKNVYFKKTSSAVRLSFLLPFCLKTLYFASPDYSGFAFIVILYPLFSKNLICNDYLITLNF